MSKDSDNRPEWRVTRAGLAHAFGLHSEAVADLEKRRVLVFDDNDQIDLAHAAARIFAEGRLLQIQALEKSAAVANLTIDLTNRINTMWTAMAAEKPSRDYLLEVVMETMEASQRIVDEMAAVIAVPIGSPERPQGECRCALN